MERAVEIFLLCLGLYLLAGAVFAAIFHARAIKTVDHAVEGATWFFRVLVTPGLVALWPLMLVRWKQGDATWLGQQDRPVRQRCLRLRHGALIVLVLVVVLAVAVPALIWRPAEPVLKNPIPLLIE